MIYLMLVDYKPTHDPNQDTFKVEYLLGGAAVLGIVWPPEYKITEVCGTWFAVLNGKRISDIGDVRDVDALGFLHLA